MAISGQEYADRRERLAALLEERGLDALFVAPSADLEYLTGIERDLPTFGNISYAHGWTTGALIAPGREPVYVLPRMFVAFHLTWNLCGAFIHFPGMRVLIVLFFGAAVCA